MSKWLFAILLCVAAVGGNAMAAVPVCSSDAVDPDGDGWGWENNASCRVEALEPTMTPICESADSDPDGDGWGWENNQSCMVSMGDPHPDPGPDPEPPTGNSPPGSDFATAGLVALNAPIDGLMQSVAVHYYRFVVDQPIAVAVDMNDEYSVEYLIVDNSSRRYFGRFSFEQNVCLVPGDYYLILSNDFNAGNAVSYTATLRTADVPCTVPTLQQALGNEVSLYLSSNADLYTYNRSDDTLSRRAADGSIIWETTADQVDRVETLPDGSVLVMNYGTITKLDAMGETLWIAINSADPASFSIGNIAVVYAEFTSIYSTDLNDGSLRWRYDIDENDYIQSGKLVATQDGRVVVATGDGELLNFTQ
ncbi:MAG: carbohydrate-binding domain-containing protein [Pseudomonadota bacterium]